jgi:hypothetical protein
LEKASGGAFFSNASACNYFIFGSKSFDTHVPFKFFFYLFPLLVMAKVKFGFRVC